MGIAAGETENPEKKYTKSYSDNSF
ncbi:hypothetical protein OL548_12280 [Lysinibacillus sp. MHQ-1]|nr:hypothetical protein OL548_12280 [Lysinibacillus sp. MHQ-1]